MTQPAFSLKQQLLNATTSCVFLSNALVVCMKVSASILSLCATLSPEANQIFNPINITFQAAGVTSGMRRLHGNTKIMSRVSVNHIRGEDASVTVQFNLTVYCDALTALCLCWQILSFVYNKRSDCHTMTPLLADVSCVRAQKG